LKPEGTDRFPHVVNVVAAAEIDIAPVLLMRSPSVGWRVEDLEQLGVDGTSAEGLRHALGPVDADGSHNVDRHDQAGRERKVDCRPSQRLFNLAKRAIARVKRNRAGDEKFGLVVRHGGRCRCSP